MLAEGGPTPAKRSAHLDDVEGPCGYGANAGGGEAGPHGLQRRQLHAVPFRLACTRGRRPLLLSFFGCCADSMRLVHFSTESHFSTALRQGF